MDAINGDDLTIRSVTAGAAAWHHHSDEPVLRWPTRERQSPDTKRSASGPDELPRRHEPVPDLAAIRAKVAEYFPELTDSYADALAAYLTWSPQGVALPQRRDANGVAAGTD